VALLDLPFQPTKGSSMRRLTVRALMLCVVVAATAAPVSAQTTPKVELSGGYQFLNFSLDGENE